MRKSAVLAALVTLGLASAVYAASASYDFTRFNIRYEADVETHDITGEVLDVDLRSRGLGNNGVYTDDFDDLSKQFIFFNDKYTNFMVIDPNSKYPDETYPLHSGAVHLTKGLSTDVMDVLLDDSSDIVTLNNGNIEYYSFDGSTMVRNDSLSKIFSAADRSDPSYADAISISTVPFEKAYWVADSKGNVTYYQFDGIGMQKNDFLSFTNTITDGLGAVMPIVAMDAKPNSQELALLVGGGSQNNKIVYKAFEGVSMIDIPQMSLDLPFNDAVSINLSPVNNDLVITRKSGEVLVYNFDGEGLTLNTSLSILGGLTTPIAAQLHGIDQFDIGVLDTGSDEFLWYSFDGEQHTINSALSIAPGILNNPITYSLRSNKTWELAVIMPYTADEITADPSRANKFKIVYFIFDGTGFSPVDSMTIHDIILGSVTGYAAQGQIITWPIAYLGVENNSLYGRPMTPEMLKGGALFEFDSTKPYAVALTTLPETLIAPIGGKVEAQLTYINEGEPEPEDLNDDTVDWLTLWSYDRTSGEPELTVSERYDLTHQIHFIGNEDKRKKFIIKLMMQSDGSDTPYLYDWKLWNANLLINYPTYQVVEKIFPPHEDNTVHNPEDSADGMTLKQGYKFKFTLNVIGGADKVQFALVKRGQDSDGDGIGDLGDYNKYLTEGEEIVVDNVQYVDVNNGQLKTKTFTTERGYKAMTKVIPNQGGAYLNDLWEGEAQVPYYDGSAVYDIHVVAYKRYPNHTSDPSDDPIVIVDHILPAKVQVESIIWEDIIIHRVN